MPPATSEMLEWKSGLIIFRMEYAQSDETIDKTGRKNIFSSVRI